MDFLGRKLSEIEKRLFYLEKDILEIKRDFSSSKEALFEITEALSRLDSSINSLKGFQTEKRDFSTNPEFISTDKPLFRPLNSKKEGISIGNRGVQTDRQTNRQTDKGGVFQEGGDSFKDSAQLLDSLSALREDIKSKFSKLTPQESFVFSTLYQLELGNGPQTYRELSKGTNLTESSVRDYVRRLILKGIPVEKEKKNNKEVFLSVSENLKKAVSLRTLLELSK